MIAAVSGYALGGGCEFTLACDFRIASDTARFGLPEIKIGAFPGGGGTQRLPRLIGVSAAKAMLLTGNPFDADYGALMQISKATGGTFYRAEDASQLSSALAKLPAAFMIVHKHVDIAALFAALGGLLIAAAVALSLWWNRVRRPAPRPGVIHP